MKEFCPRCGKEKGPFVKGLCIACFSEKMDPIKAPGAIKFEQCKTCGKINLHGVWVEQTPQHLKELVFSKIKLNEFEEVKKEIKLIEGFAEVKINGKIEETPLNFERKIKFDPRNASCQGCSRVFGNYFEAIIQLRFEKKTLSKLSEKLKKIKKQLYSLEKKDSLAKIIKVSEEKNGTDLYIGSTNAAKKIVSLLQKESNQKAVVSTTLAGVDKQTGKNKYRTTFCLRF